jgi:hypothetical protein
MFFLSTWSILIEQKERGEFLRNLTGESYKHDDIELDNVGSTR